MKPSIPTISAESDILYHRLAKVQPAEVVTYVELSALIKRNVQKDARGLLHTARCKAKREDGVVFVPVIGLGLKRASGHDFIGIATTGMERGRRVARKALNDSLLMPKDEYEQLTRDEQTVLNVDRTLLGTLMHFATEKARKRIAPSVQAQGDRLAIGDVLKWR
jgi:hypothetical protein